MNITVQSSNIDVSQPLQQQIEGKIKSNFKRFGQHIHRIEVSFADINGPKGGQDKSCRLQIYTKLGNDVIITGTYDGLLEAIDTTCGRAKHSLASLVDKTNSRGRHKPKLAEA